MNLLQLIPAHFFTFDRKKRRRRRTVAGVDQEEFHDLETIADPDSLFYNFRGTPVHHKICHGKDEYDHQSGGRAAAAHGRLSMILLHGFASWVFSWGEVMKPLAGLTGWDVLAFDRPGFGLTPRVNHCSSSSRSSTEANSLATKSDSSPYSMAFSAAATLSFLDLLGSHKGVLMGHSAGCFVAVDAYFKTPDRVSALILVAPAIVAPFGRRRPRSSSDEEENERMVKKRGSYNEDERTIRSSGGLFQQGNFWNNGLTRVLCAVVLTMLVHLMRGVKVTITSMYRRILLVLLRSTFAVFLTRILIDKYGLSTVRKAWFDDTKVTDYVIQNYARPLKVKGWEKALLEHILSLFTHPSESLEPFNRRLSEISCPVLIVTGDSDRIVPAWNSMRLSSAIAGSTLEVINDCGHLPHEEKPKEFPVVVDKFLRALPTATQSKP